MKIALLNGSVFSCPPRGYGSEIEAFVLARELCRRGHEAHLFGPGGSRHPGTGGHLHYTRGSYGMPSTADADVLRWYGDILRACDVVHDLSPTCRTVEDLYLEGAAVPYLYTRNGIDFTFPRFGRHNAVVLSAAARACALSGAGAWDDTPYAGSALDSHSPKLGWAEVVRYGVSLEPADEFGYWPEGEPEDYMLYVGRPHPAKGVGRIIELARRMPGLRFVLAWRASSPDHEHFDAEYRKQAAGLANVEFVTLPAVGQMAAKRSLYQRARALITLPVYVEAFGLTTIEALACGTPVVATNRGAAPEIIRPGETGFLVSPEEDEFDALEAAVRGIARIGRAGCRRDAEARWSVGRMADDYLGLYRRAAGGETFGPSDRMAWQWRCVEQTSGLVLNAGCKEDPAGLKAGFGPRVVNMDRSLVDEDAARRGESVPIPVDVQHDMLRRPWPFADGMFEMAVLAEVLEDLPPGSQPAVLAEVRRVARRLCITCPTDTPERDAHHLTTITEERLREWLTRAGWRPVKWQRATYVLDHGRAVLPGNFVLAEVDGE